MHEPAKPWPTIRTSESDKFGFRVMRHPRQSLLPCLERWPQEYPLKHHTVLPGQRQLPARAFHG